MDGSGGVGVDLTSFPELTQALIATAQAATQAVQAASAAAAATGVQAGGESSEASKKDLAKLIPRPGVFNPSDREQEILQWRDWYWCLKQYLVVVDSEFQSELEKIEKDLTVETEWDLMDSKEQQRSRFLYSLLGSLIQGRLIGLIKNVDNFNGHEALRQLLVNCQPQARNRTMSLLQGTMAYPNFNMKTSILPQILKLEEHFNQYEKLGGKLTPDLRSAVLLRVITGPLKIHLNMTLNEGSSYQKIREAVLAFDTANTKWNESAELSFTSTTSPIQFSADPSGLAPMEIDRVQKGDGKSKGMKGKGGKDGKGKSKGGKEDKGKGKGKGKPLGGKPDGKGKASKEQKGKGKGVGDTCWTCGRPGHHSKDCWRVRQVEAPPSHSGGSSSQTTTSPSTTLSTTSGGESGVTKAIRRVSQPVVFDLRGSVEEEAGSIRVLTAGTEGIGGERKKVEFFNMDVDDYNELAKMGGLSIKMVGQRSEELEREKVEEEVTIIVDSGADASLFPGFMLRKGERIRGGGPLLQDAQGTQIKTFGHRDVSITLQAEDDREVILKERVTFSDVVAQPILSFGHLLRAGWSIDAKEHCMYNGSVRVPLTFQNNSLVVKGSGPRGSWMCSHVEGGAE